VREFSPEAEFNEPIDTFILSNISCHYCNRTRDLDLLRDNDSLKCTHCFEAYDIYLIEYELVVLVQKLIASQQVQDLICKKCKLVKAENMALLCSNCSGDFKRQDDIQSIKSRLHIFHKVAVHHKFEWLKEVVELVQE